MIIKYFRWTIDYDANLAKKWLDWKLASVDGPEREYVEIMKSVVRDGNRPNLNNSEAVRNLIAEYVGYQNAPPSATAHLFYVAGDDGWAIFPELPPTPLAIKVRPDDDDVDKIALTFTQMTQQVYADVGNGLKVRGTIKRFTYQVQFAYIDPAKTMLQATLWHPDAGKSGNL